jgi:hypothetical protein
MITRVACFNAPLILLSRSQTSNLCIDRKTKCQPSNPVRFDNFHVYKLFWYNLVAPLSLLLCNSSDGRSALGSFCLFLLPAIYISPVCVNSILIFSVTVLQCPLGTDSLVIRPSLLVNRLDNRSCCRGCRSGRSGR